MCDHCSAMTKVLTELVGNKVSRVIMKRVTNELHGQSATFETEATGISAEAVSISPIVPKRYVLPA